MALRVVDRCPADRSGLARPSRVLIAVGGCCVVLGGLVAAVTRPLGLTDGSWLAAYLVLVCGVAQYAIGRAPTVIAGRPLAARPGWALVGCWNVGSALVIAGTLATVPAVVDVGSVFLVVALALAWRSVRRTDASTVEAPVPWVVDWAYRAMLLVLIVSIPVGAVLAQVQNTS